MPTKPYGKTVVGVVAVCWSPTSHDRQQPAPPGLSRQPRNGFDSTPEPPRVSWRLWPPDLVREFTPSRPDQLWWSTTPPANLVGDGAFTAIVTNVIFRPSVGWRTASRRPTELLAGRAGAGVDALELAWTRWGWPGRAHWRAGPAHRANSRDRPTRVDRGEPPRRRHPAHGRGSRRTRPRGVGPTRGSHRSTLGTATATISPPAGLGGGGNAAGRAGGSPRRWVSSCPPSGEQQTVVFARRS